MVITAQRGRNFSPLKGGDGNLLEHSRYASGRLPVRRCLPEENINNLSATQQESMYKLLNDDGGDRYDKRDKQVRVFHKTGQFCVSALCFGTTGHVTNKRDMVTLDA